MRTYRFAVPRGGRPGFRRVRAERIYEWLADRPDLWKGKEFKNAVASPWWLMLARTLKDEGFYSQKTYVLDIRVDRLVAGAKLKREGR